MSSNSDSSKAVAKDPDGDRPTAGQEKDTNEDRPTKTMKNGKELLTKLESYFSALMKAIMGKFGQQLSGSFKDSLVFHLQRTHCREKSEVCPICRDGISVGMKHLLIDEIIQLLVDLSLTEEEKKERISITQQR